MKDSKDASAASDKMEITIKEITSAVKINEKKFKTAYFEADRSTPLHHPVHTLLDHMSISDLQLQVQALP